MTHPDRDPVIGRLLASRLRGPADAHDGTAGPCPDAEQWAAYVDGGLASSEVSALDAHLARCRACRQLLNALAVEGVPAPVEAAPAGGAVVLTFPRRQVFVWMSMAAGLLAAITVWSVTRLERSAGPESSVAARSEPAPSAPAPVNAPRSAGATPPTDAAPTPSVPAPAAPAAESDASKDAYLRSEVPSAKRDEALALEQQQALASRAAAARVDEVTSRELERKVEEERLQRLADAAAITRPAERQAAGREAQQAARAPASQANAAGAVGRGHGPMQQNTQQNVQQNAPAAQAPTPPPAPPAPAASPSPDPARDALAVAAPLPAPRANELAETVVTTGAPQRVTAGGRAAPADARAKAASAEQEASQRERADMPLAAFRSSMAAALSFHDPEGRLRWRVADGRRLESSSDGGATWTPRHTSRERIHAGAAPSIEAAWAVGEAGLVLRLAVPGGWAPVTRPAPVSLIAVSATSAQAARVTAADGRVFETTDGGQTWTPLASGAAPR